jgi:uncharacterized protein (TIGR03435 family)
MARPSLLAITGLTVLALNAQSASQFEVASVIPHALTEGSHDVSLAGDPGRLNYTNVTLRGLIREAYGLKVYPPSHGPDATDRYDVVATMRPQTSKQQRMLMLQALLAERFKLVVHRETKELPTYALVAGKKGSKLREVEDDGSAAEIGSGSGHQIKAHHVSMKMLAAALQGYIGDTVVDATGLAGLFDLSMDFNVDESMSAEGPTVFEAVQRQLGLKLEGRKGPVEVVVIDRFEMPSVN